MSDLATRLRRYAVDDPDSLLGPAADEIERLQREAATGVDMLTEEQQRHAETQRALIIANTTQANLRQHITVAHQALRKCRQVLNERWAKPDARAVAVKAANTVLGERDE